MADPVVQVRIRDLLAYTQLDVSDPNYINPDTISIVLDHPDWEMAKRMPLTDLAVEASGIHMEVGKLTNLSSRTVIVTFNTAFSVSPIGSEPQVYRLTQMSDGTYRKQEVLWGFIDANQPTATGFTLKINELENLTGIIIEYEYK